MMRLPLCALVRRKIISFCNASSLAPLVLKRSRAPEKILHPSHALARRLFGGARAAPMCFKTQHAAVAVFFQCAKLANVVYDAAPHCSPFGGAVRLANDVFAVHVADSIFRQKRVAIREWRFAASGCVAGVPVQLEVRRSNCGERSRSLGAGGSVTRLFIFEQQRNAALASLRRGFDQFFIYCRAMGFLVFKPPEIEDAHPVRVEGAREFKPAFQKFVLLFERKVCAKLVAL